MAGKAPGDVVFTKGLTPHELRHTAASLAVSAGANLKAVQRMLGHASAAMPLDVYSGVFDDDLDGVAERRDVGARVYSMCTEAPWCHRQQKAQVADLRFLRSRLSESNR